MKSALLTLMFISLLGDGLQTISRINTYAQQAAQAYARQEYSTAIAAYTYLLNDLEVADDQLRLNLAHAYYQAKQLTAAQQEYRLLADHPTPQMRAIAHLQLGNIAALKKQYKQALALYKQALVAESDNEAARYNYELLKRYLVLHPEKAQLPPPPLPPPTAAPQDSLLAPPPAEQGPQPKKTPDAAGSQQAEADRQQPDAEGQAGQGGSSEEKRQDTQPLQQEKQQASGTEKGNTQGQNRDSRFDPSAQQRSGGREHASGQEQRAQTQRARLQQVNLSPEKAALLLEAMRNAEMQYLQQLPKKPGKKPDRSRPDW